MENAVIETNNLTKEYDQKTVVNNLNHSSSHSTIDRLIA